MPSLTRHRPALLFSLTGLFALHLASAPAAHAGAANPLAAEIDRRAAAAEGRLIEWRRHFHQNPELSGREVETAKFVAARLREFGLEPRTIAGTGVTAVIEGKLPGATIGLRADMDALPVAEQVDLSFRSTATGTYEGKSVPVMHACGHDTHTAMLLAAAGVLAGLRDRLPGRVVLLFQPAEEGVPAAEGIAGAERMIAEGALSNPKVDAVFGIHAFAGIESGTLGYRHGSLLAAGDRFEIQVQGKQAHGSKPWAGVDPIVAGSAIVTALQTLVSRESDLTHEPVVVTVGQFEAGVRNNIIPDRARLVGTMRTFDEAMRADLQQRMQRMVEHVAAGYGATAKVTFNPGYPVTSSNAAFVDELLPTLERVAPGRVREVPKITASEDFSLFANQVPGVFLFLGVTPKADLATAASNHSPLFYVDEAALPTGVRAYAQVAADYLFAHAKAKGH
ncbi:MAG: amidohydrolase [Thermoanaerobaculia bacterium]|nr:amidohydrolase [Thermoanaerobaculia bacterium]